MTYDEAFLKLAACGQEHVLHYYDKLSDERKAELLSAIDKIDFDAFKTVVLGQKSELGEITPADSLSLKDVKKGRARYTEAGLSAIMRGKVAAVILAGGQGTRLGYNGPKGTFDIGVNKHLYIFECLFNNIKDCVKKAGVLPHVFIMTSYINDAETQLFLKAHAYFGYDKDKIHFFKQGVSPAIDRSGKILMEEKYRPVLSPDGNGGWFNALIGAGYSRLLKKEGIEWLNLVSVDNVLQRICDPVFIGATLSCGAMCGAKVVKKVSPEERVGVVCKEDGSPAVIEYYDMPQKLKVRHDLKGELVFCYGATLNYLFNLEKLKAVTRKKLPYHLADKKIPCLKGGRKFVPEQPNAYKLERLAVDLIKLMGTCIAVEVDREKEFAPVKNAEGVDSVVSARALLAQNGVKL